MRYYRKYFLNPVATAPGTDLIVLDPTTRFCNLYVLCYPFPLNSKP
jgi:hypothetical protein